jgi:glycosyltransferase involved in cell wall biosynthesis
MNISVVIPARNDIENLKKCINHIKASIKKPSEILVVDDASDPGLDKGLSDRDISIIKFNEQRGPASARNVGAKAAKGDVIVFLDSDVFIKKDTIEKIAYEFEEYGEDAVVGVFDDYQQYRSFFGDYKNLWMKYSYEKIPERAALFYTSLAAVKKSVFLKTGGFDENHKRPSTEDTAYGNVLWNNGIRPLMNREINAIHNKEYSFYGILKTDFFRASDLLKMKLRKDLGEIQTGHRTSVPVFFIISVFSTLMAFMLFFATGKYLILTSLLLLSILLNLNFLMWLFKKRGFVFALKSAAFIPFDHFAVLAGMAFGFLSYISGNRY